MLEVDIADKFTDQGQPCVDAVGSFFISGYKSDTFYSIDHSGRRPIYVDEIEKDSGLKTAVLEFLTAATA